MMILPLLAAAAALSTSSPPVGTLEETFTACWERKAVGEGDSDAPAERVVDAALAACAQERQAYRSQALGGPDEGPRVKAVQLELLDQWEDHRRQQIVQRVRDERQRD